MLLFIAEPLELVRDEISHKIRSAYCEAVEGLGQFGEVPIQRWQGAGGGFTDRVSKDQRLEFRRVARMHLAELAKEVVVESSVVGLCFAAIYSAAVRGPFQHMGFWTSHWIGGSGEFSELRNFKERRI